MCNDTLHSFAEDQAVTTTDLENPVKATTAGRKLLSLSGN